MQKPILFSKKYLIYFLIHITLITLIFGLFDYLDHKELQWDTNRFLLSVAAYIVFTIIQYRWDVHVFNNPEKYPQAKEPKYINKTYQEHQADRAAQQKEQS